MKLQMYSNLLVIFAISVIYALPALSQDSLQTTIQKKSKNNRLSIPLSEQDIMLPVTSIEFGSPDRWSFTSRFIHSCHIERNIDPFCGLHFCVGT